MGQENYKISQLPEKTSADSTDLMEVSTLVDSSYESKKISVGQIAETAMGTMTYEDLTTTAKTIVGAINELVNSGQSIEVEPLSVTENGIYTAEEGKAYSPVTVNVKSEIEHDGSTSDWWDDSCLVPVTVDGNPVTLNSPVAQNAISTILSYSPKQSGTGDPSPQNIRPIEGWTEANLGVNSETPTITANLGGTYYGFSVDVERGVLRSTREMVVLDGSERGWNEYLTSAFWIFVDGKKTGWKTSICNEFKNINYAWALSDYGVYSDYNSDNRCYFRPPNASIVTLADFKTWLSQNPIQLCYELATPLELPLTPQTVALLSGNNTLWTDGDSLSVTYKASIQQNQLSALNSSLSFGDPMSTQTTDESEMEELDTVPDITDDTETNIVSNRDIELDGLSDTTEED